MTAISPHLDRFPRTVPRHEAHDGPLGWVSLVVAAWLLIAPLVLPGDIHTKANTWLVGTGIAAVGVIALYAPRARFVNTALGAYLIASSLALPLSAAARANAVICGVIVVMASLLRGRFSSAS